jgi:hypothetical protein
MGGQMDKYVDGWMDERTGKQMAGWMHVWMNR